MRDSTWQIDGSGRVLPSTFARRILDSLLFVTNENPDEALLDVHLNALAAFGIKRGNA
jgi:hypothetical protein